MLSIYNETVKSGAFAQNEDIFTHFAI